MFITDYERVRSFGRSAKVSSNISIYFKKEK